MNTAFAEIDTCSPSVEKVSNKRWHSHNEVWQRLEKKFNDFYGTDYRLDYRL